MLGGGGGRLVNGVFTLAEMETYAETETKTDGIGFHDNVQKCLHGQVLLSVSVSVSASGNVNEPLVRDVLSCKGRTHRTHRLLLLIRVPTFLSREIP